MTVNLKGNLQTKVGGKWITCSFITHDKEFDKVCVRPIGYGIVVVSYEDVRNTPETHTLGSVWEHTSSVSFDKQEGDTKKLRRFILACHNAGLIEEVIREEEAG